MYFFYIGECNGEVSEESKDFLNPEMSGLMKCHHLCNIRLGYDMLQTLI